MWFSSSLTKTTTYFTNNVVKCIVLNRKTPKYIKKVCYILYTNYPIKNNVGLWDRSNELQVIYSIIYTRFSGFQPASQPITPAVKKIKN